MITYYAREPNNKVMISRLPILLLYVIQQMIFRTLVAELQDSEDLKYSIVVQMVIVAKLLTYGDWGLACIHSISKNSHSWQKQSMKSKPEQKKKNSNSEKPAPVGSVM